MKTYEVPFGTFTNIERETDPRVSRTVEEYLRYLLDKKTLGTPAETFLMVQWDRKFENTSATELKQMIDDYYFERSGLS